MRWRAREAAWLLLLILATGALTGIAGVGLLALLPRLLVVGDLIDRECPRLLVHASREDACALFASCEALRFVPIVDDDGLLVGEACREDFAS